METDMNAEQNILSGRSSVIVLAVVHGLYFVISGIWPIIHMDSFLAVTGPKTDLWLVRTVGILVFFIGAGLLIAAAKKEVSYPLILTVAGSALGLTLIDIIYVWQNVIPPVYLLDAMAEIILLTCWIVTLYKSDQYELFHEKRM